MLLRTRVDGAAAWLMVAAGFSVYLVSVGFQYITGIWYKQWLREPVFEGRVSPADLAWATSLEGTLFLLGSIAAGKLIVRTSCSVTTALGAGLLLLGALAAAYIDTPHTAGALAALYIFFGVTIGVGTALAHVAAIISVQPFFRAQRGLATGITVSGSGVGSFVLGPIMETLVTTHGWRVALAAYGVAACTVCCVAAAVMASVALVEADDAAVGGSGAPSCGDGGCSSSSSPEGTPTAADSATSPATAPPGCPQPAAAVELEGRAAAAAAAGGATPDDEAHVSPTTPGGGAASLPLASEDSAAGGGCRWRDHDAVVAVLARTASPAAAAAGATTTRWSQCSAGGDASASTAAAAASPPAAAPTCTATTTAATTTSAPAPAVVAPSYRGILRARFFQSYSFFIVFFGLAWFTIPTYLPVTVRETLGGGSSDVSAVVAAHGVANTVGRVLMGVLADRLPAHKVRLLAACMLVAACGSLGFTLSGALGYAYAYGAIVGGFGGAIVSIQPAVIIDALGMPSLPLAQGAVNGIQAPFALAGAPVGGALRAATGGYAATWAFVAACFGGACLLAARIDRVHGV